MLMVVRTILDAKLLRITCQRKAQAGREPRAAAVPTYYAPGGRSVRRNEGGGGAPGFAPPPPESFSSWRPPLRLTGRACSRSQGARTFVSRFR